MNENYSIENDVGNHKLLISQYNNKETNDNDIINFEEKRKTRPQAAKYRVNLEKIPRSERLKQPNNIIIDYNYLKNKNNNDKNSSDEKNIISNRRYSNANERKEEQIKTNINYINGRLI